MTLGDVCELYQPKTISSSEFVPKEMYDVFGTNMLYDVFGANGVIGKYKEFNHEMSMVVVSCRGAGCGRINRTQPKSWITGNSMVVKPKDARVHNEFFYQVLKSLNVAATISGSAQPQITQASLSSLEFIMPPIDLLSEYSCRIDESVHLRLKIQLENLTIRRIYQLLLSKISKGL